MVFMASGGEIKGSENKSPWMDRKRPDLPSLTGTNNTNWETAAVKMSVDEGAIRKATDKFNNPVECW